MNVKTRLATVVLAGILVGLIAVRLQTHTGSIESGVVSFDDETRRAALEALQSMKDQNKKSEVIGGLANRRSLDPDPRVRVFALYALRKTGWNGPRVINSLVRGLKDKDENVRREATVGIMEVGQGGLGALVALMNDPAVRGIASDVVRTLPPQSVAQLNGLLHNDLVQQRGAAFVISKIQRPETIAKAAELTPTLAGMLASSDGVLATNAAFAIHALNPNDPRPVDVFLASLKKDNWDGWDVRGWDALAALVAMPASHARAVPVLKSLLPSAQDGILKNRRFKRPAIGDALAVMAPRDGSVSARAADLKSKDGTIRWRAAYAISIAPSVDPEYMAPLAGLLSDPDKAVVTRAFYALDRMGLRNTERASTTVYPKLVSAFERIGGGEIPGFWLMAAPALASLGQPITPLILTEVKEGKLDPFKAATVFRCFSVDLAPTGALMTALHSDNTNLRVVAAMGLAKQSPVPDGVREELQKQAAERQPPFKNEIEKALAQITKG